MSHLVKQSQLKEILEHSWRKTKDRYDGTFNAVELTPNTSTEKKLKFTKVGGGNTVDIDLVDYARLTDRSKFKEDVSVDGVAVVNNLYLGNGNTVTSQDRSLGFRGLTTKGFVDGYVKYIEVYMDDNLDVGTQTTWKVWSITKGATNRNDDRVKEVIHSSKVFNIERVQKGGQEKKVVKIPIDREYQEETYFIVRCTTHGVRVITGINSAYNTDIVNLSDANQPSSAGQPIRWDTNADGSNTAMMYIYGRESIGSLSEKIDAIKSGQVLSVNTQRPDANGNITIGISNIPNLQEELDKKVPKTDLVATGGTAAEQNKVPKLDANGKLHTSFIPEIAIVRVKEAANETAAQGMIGEGENQLQTGDVVVLANTKKAYMYKGNNTNNFANDFLELTMGNGTVKSVSGGTPDTNGNVSVSVVEGGATGITMSFGNGGTPVTVATYMTTNEVQTIKDIFNS